MLRPLSLVAIALIAVLCLPVAAAAQKEPARQGSTQQESDALSESVRELSRHQGSGRIDWLAGALTRIGCAVERQRFVPARGAVGTNLIVTIGTGGPTIVLTAHSDCVGTSPGANDDASGCAVLLRLAADLHERAGSKEGLSRKVVIAFLDQSVRGRRGSAAILDAIGSERVLACLNLDLVGSGEALLLGPVAPEGDDLAVRLLETYVEGEPPETLPRAALDEMPPGDHETFRRRGLDAVTIMMAPATEVAALREHLQWKRRPGEKRPPAPPTLARAGSPKDRPDIVSGASLATALRVAHGWLALALESQGVGNPVLADYAASCRNLARLLSFGVGEGLGAREGSHVDLLAGAGPRGVFRTVLKVVEADDTGKSRPAVRRVLETFLVGHELRGTVRALFEEAGAPPLLDGLRDLYRNLGPRMVWNPEIPGIVLRK